ncbi:hypothetical protein BDV93DRAFT_284597 [Ceratobasidium sp. AG-I]|nr:hypothetical protein BDV93DRAFT_284597 [Ceratobasidium sp. AG-I]
MQKLASSSTAPRLAPEFDSTYQRKAHFYNDGNILLNVQGHLFRVHKSMLALHSQTFSDMFNLPPLPNPATGTDEVTLYDEPTKFASLLDALYKGANSVRTAGFHQILGVIELAQKYEMTELEADFQTLLQGRLPVTGTDPLEFPDRAKNYRDDPSLAPTVLRFGDPKLHPWAFYYYGIHLTSNLEPSDTPINAIPPLAIPPVDGAWSPVPILRQLIHQTIQDWNSQIGGFYFYSCPKTAMASAPGTESICSRYGERFSAESSSLYLPPNELHKDPMDLMEPRIKEFNDGLSTHGGAYCKWCPGCTGFLKAQVEKIVQVLYDRLVKCVT